MNIQKAERNSIPVMLVFALMAFAIFSSIAFAAQCLTEVSTTTSTSRATTGTSVTITATTTGTSCTISSLALVSTPSLTVNDPASGQYSGFSAGTAKDFSVTGGTAGTYTYYARGTTSDGSVDSTAQILEFVSPSDLTVTSTPASASVTQDNTFSLTINVQNPSASDVTTSYTINLPSGLTRQSGDPASSSGTTISASSTKALSLTIKHSTCFTGTKSITFDIGDTTGAASASVTGNSTCATASNASSSSSSGGGGGGGGAGVVTEAHTFAQITPGAASIKKFTNPAIGLKEISIEVNNLANNVRITVTKLAGQPASVTKSVTGKVFQYIEINASNIAGNIKNAALTFDVSKSWLSQNGLEKSHVVLQRYTTDWEKLPTTIIGEDANNVKYQATTTGFSVFAVTAEKPAAAPAPAPAPEQPTPTPTEQPAPAPAQPIKLPGLPPLDATTLGVFIVAIIIIIGAVYYMLTKKKRYKAQ